MWGMKMSKVKLVVRTESLPHIVNNISMMKGIVKKVISPDVKESLVIVTLEDSYIRRFMISSSKWNGVLKVIQDEEN